jgi:hypothetical protein
MVVTGYYIQRLSDGKILVGQGPNSDPSTFQPQWGLGYPNQGRTT